MNRALIVGHYSSYYKQLEAVLGICGMKKALPSFTHQLTPQEISLKLIQLSNLKDDSNLNDESKDLANLQKNLKNSKQKTITQNTPNTIWDNLAFDLLLANAEQSFWGWSDENAVSLLEYWANFDKELVFILTYDKPDNVFKSLVQKSSDDLTDKTIIQNMFSQWAVYNETLLEFYQKYPNRCLLVNGERVLQSVEDYVQLLNQKIGLSVNLDALNTDKVAELSSVKEKASGKNQDLVNFFIKQLVAKNKRVNLIFSKLQQVADLALIQRCQYSADTFTMLQNILQQQKLNKSINQQLINIKKDFLEKEQSWEGQLSKKNDAYQQEKKKLKQIKDQLTSKQQENELLITQLHQVQEELEKYYLDNQQIKEKLKMASQELQSIKQTGKAQEKLAKEAQSKLKDAQAELQKLQNNQKSFLDAQQENELLITQLHQVQEELEKYYLENQRLKSEDDKTTNQLVKPIYYGAADRVKQDLPYRLGATMVDHSKSAKDLVKLPFALVKEYQKFQKTHTQQEELPPVEEYQDAYEAEKVKRHLSYKLGKTLVDGIKSPKSILDLPMKMGKEVVGFGKN